MQRNEFDERLFTGYTGQLVILLAISWFIINTGRYIVPAVLPQISVELGISSSQVGFAMTLTWALYALSQYPSGHLADQLTRKTVLVGSFLTVLAGFAWLALMASYLGFLLALSLIGIGSALFFTPSRAIISDLFSERRGTAVSIQVAAGRAGSAAAGPITAVALTLAVWQTSFLPVLGLLVVTLVLMDRYNRDSYVLKPVGLDIQGTVQRVFATGRTRLVLIAYILFAFGVQSITTFLPTILQVEKGFSAEVASLSFTLLFLVGIVSSLIAGGLGDRFSRLGVGTGSLSLSAVGIAILLWAPTSATVIAAIVIFGAGVWAFPPVMQAYLMDILSAESLGNDFGAVKTVYSGVGSLGPSYVGIVAEWTSYSTAFVGVIVVLAAGAAVLGWLVLIGQRATQGKDDYRKAG